MLTNYINAAMGHGTFEKLDSGEWYGEIPETPGVWATGTTFEAARDELLSVLEGWIILGLREGQTLPAIDGIDVTPALPKAS